MEIPSARLQKKLIGPCIICGAEGFEGKFRRFTEDAYRKALQHRNLDSTWVLDVTQFCNSHYMSYIVNGTNIEKSFRISENTVSLKRRLKDEDIEGEVIVMTVNASEMNDDGRIGE